MAALTSRSEFETLFDTFTRSAWRLECQGTYQEPEEAEPMRQYFAGDDDLDWFVDWLDWVGDVRATGRAVGRVRVLTDPLTRYLQFQLGSITGPAVDAGEDIRVLPAGQFAALEVPREDFWLFDDATVGVLRFGFEGVTGVEVVEGDAVGEYLDRKRRVLDASIHYRDWRA